MDTYAGQLVPLAEEAVRGLIDESNHVFLPTRSRPDETAASMIEKFRTDPLFQIYGYKLGGIAVSYIVRLSNPIYEQEVAIGPMYVAESARGQGLGLHQVEEFVALHGAYRLLTKTWAQNKAALRIFEHAGFREEGRLINDRVDGDDTVILRRYPLLRSYVVGQL